MRVVILPLRHAKVLNNDKLGTFLSGDIAMSQIADTDKRTPRRLSHTLQSRLITVQEIQPLTPHLLRILFSGDALSGFDSPGFDDHVKLCFPDPHSGEIILPGSGGEKKPLMREYTPRYFDSQTNILAIDFVLHNAGIATQWASNAKPGDTLGMAGPKNSFIIPLNFDWHLLIGDDTALPAIARRLEELPDTTQAIVIAEVDTPADEIILTSNATVKIYWLHRHGSAPGSADLFLQKLQKINFPAGDYYSWAACEYSAIKLLRAALTDKYGVNPQWLRAASYWQK